MKVSHVTFHFEPDYVSISGAQSVSFSEGSAYPDLHYITREGQHIVNFTHPRDGRRHGIGFPMSGVRQTNTVL